jgi:tripartite-type tricarboxylate transporter receptor subunit TctC
MAEVIPKFEMGCNTGFFATGGTPKRIIDKLNAEIMKAVAQPRMRELLTSNSAEPAPWSPGEFKQHVVSEVRDWRDVVRSAGLKVD